MKTRVPAHKHTRSTGTRRATSRREQTHPEVRFMTEMIDHHAMAVTMSEKHLKEVEHPELKQLCESIITSQREEIERMQDWYGIEHKSGKAKH